MADEFQIADLHGLDRDVARTATEVLRTARAEQAERARGDAATTEARDPFTVRRHVAGRSTFVALGEAAAAHPASFDAPLREGLRRWVYAFTVARIVRPKQIDLDEAMGEAVAIVPRPVSRKISWNEAWKSVTLATVAGDVATYLQAAANAGPLVADASREVEAVAHEASVRLGETDPAAFATGLTRAQLTAFARSFLDRSEDIARHAQRSARKRREGTTDSPADFLSLAMGREAVDGWPAQLTRRWLEDLAPALVRGIAMDVGTLPAALGASSFARALAMYGRALRVAGPSPSLPFSLARDPFAVDAERFGFAFASLVASAPFHRRHLGVVARLADQQARVGSGLLLASARLLAVCWLANGGGTGSRARDDEGELVQRLFGAPVPAGLARAFPLARTFPQRSDAAALAALLGVRSFVTGLVDRHDEDWFANPRALGELRARAAAPAHLPPTAEEAKATSETEGASLALHFERALA